MIKTFRGILADGAQDRIRLSTKKGKIGYQIVNLEIIGNKPGLSNPVESLIAIWKVEQTSTPTTIDFSDGNLLAVALWTMGETTYSHDLVIIFDNEVFNQDVYVTHVDIQGAEACNYMLKLETQTLTDNANAVSTLRDIRLNPQKHA